MYSLINKSFCFFVFLYSFYLNLSYSNAATGPEHDKIVVCYIGTWAVYRPGKGSFAIEHLDPNLCTHVVYAFVGLNTTHDSIRSLDPWQDLADDYGKNGFYRTVSLKNKYPHLKVTVAIGGWNEGSANYSSLVAEPGRRKRFVANALEFVSKYEFDGLDLDWEFPGKRGGAPHDKQNFLLLVKELRAAFNAKNYLLTAAFGAGKDTIDIAYDVAELSKYLDYVHLMCYDYHGTWDMRTGANAPLRSTDALNVEYSVTYMIKLGMDPSKLIMGVPLYGRTFYLTDELTSGQGNLKLGSTAKNVGFQGPFTRENGFMGYNEICVELQNETLGWKKYWDAESLTPYAINEDRVIVYDDEKSIIEKVKFAVQKKLGGAMVWSIDTDDFLGECSLGNNAAANNDQRFNDNFPLMHTINEAIIEALKDVENEIPDESYRDVNKNDGGGASTTNIHSFLFVFLMAVVFLY